MRPKTVVEAISRMRMLEAEQRNDELHPPRTLQEELARQDAIQRRFFERQALMEILAPYRARNQEKWRRRALERKARAMGRDSKANSERIERST